VRRVQRLFPRLSPRRPGEGVSQAGDLGLLVPHQMQAALSGVAAVGTASSLDPVEPAVRLSPALLGLAPLGGEPAVWGGALWGGAVIRIRNSRAWWRRLRRRQQADQLDGDIGGGRQGSNIVRQRTRERLQLVGIGSGLDPDAIDLARQHARLERHVVGDLAPGDAGLELDRG
jgi:hypothetical protein